MCIIVAKPAGVDKPDMETCFNTNPDGAGFMFVRDNKVQIRKGLMTYPAFCVALDREALTAADPVVYHFRIATAGGITPGLTHPFPVSTNRKKLLSYDTDSEIAVAHNGIITINHKKNESDTMCFVSSILADPVITDNLSNNAIQAMVESFIGRSKLSIMYNTGKIDLIGDWIQAGEVWYSNTSYIPVITFKTDHKCLRCGGVLDVWMDEYFCIDCESAFYEEEGKLYNWDDDDDLRCPRCGQYDLVYEVNDDNMILCSYCETWYDESLTPLSV